MKPHYALVALILAACIEPPRTEDQTPDAPIVLGLAPSVDVHITDPVRIAFSEPLLPGDVNVARADGRLIRSTNAMTEGGDELVVAPDPTWPEGEMLFVTVGDGFVAPDGRMLTPLTDRLRFETITGAIPSPRPIVRAPTPGTRAPSNLRYIAVASSPPLPTPLGPAYLQGGVHPVPVEAVRTHETAVLFEVRGALEPDSSYQLLLAHTDVAPGDPATIAVLTSTSVDDVAPTVTSTRVTFDGDRLYVDVDADEPIVATGAAVDIVGRTIPLLAHPMAAAQVRLEPAAPVASGVELAVHVTLTDLAGNPAVPLRLTIRSPDAIRAHINEIVPTPLHDWSDSEGGDVPFDARPGTGAITSTDEWIELVNDSDEPVVIPSAGLEIRTIDRTPAVTFVHGAPALYFGDGGTPRAWWPGEALVVRTRGDMSQANLTVELWSGTTLLDRVSLGGHQDADHPGGSPPDVWFESVARTVDGRMAWCVPTPGDPLPAERCIR